MKKFIMLALFAGFLTFSVSSCSDDKTREEVLIEDMQDQGADVNVKNDGGTENIKMETENEKLKIKTDEDGDTQIKHKEKN